MCIYLYIIFIYVYIYIYSQFTMGQHGSPGSRRPLILFGHSRGAAPATCVAYRQPERVKLGLKNGGVCFFWSPGVLDLMGFNGIL